MSIRHATALSALGALALAACSDQTPVAPVAPPTLSVAGGGSGDGSGTYLVRFKGKGVPRDFASRVAALGGEVVFAHAGVGVAAVSGLDDTRAARVAARNDVAAVDPDMVLELPEPTLEVMEVTEPESPTNPAAAAFFGRQWNMKAIDAPAAWAAGKLGSPAVRVGILDTGIDYLHPDLYGRVDLSLSRSFLSAAENARVPAGFHEVADLNYHGTHVAATVVSNGLIAAGVTSRVTLVGLKVCSPGTAANNFRGTCPTSGTLAAILYAADNGLDVINLSLGGTFQRRDASARGGNGPSFIATINQVYNYAKTRGTAIVVSAGNDALDMDHDGNGYKAYCSTAATICVSATGPTAAGLYATPAYPTLGEYLFIENIDALASYSNYGRSSVDVAAPGGNAIPVWAACSGFTLHPLLAGCRGRFYDPETGAYSASVVGISGTSMAAPHATGVAALIASDGAKGPAQIEARLKQSADDLGQPGTDPAYGKGRINAARAVGVQ